MRFKLRQMEVFRAVMLTGSMNGAAKLLFVSQPAVSRLIAHAEQSLGLQLFARDKGKLTPTPEAQRLFEEVGPLFEEALRIDELARDRPPGRGRADAVRQPQPALNFLPPAIARYRAAPRRAAQVPHHAAGRHGARAAGPQGRAGDLGAAGRPSQPGGRTAGHGRDGLHPAGRPSAGRAAAREPAQLAACRLVLYSRNIPFGQLVAAAFQRAGVSWSAAVDIMRAEVACALVRAGAGVAIVDQFSVGGQGWPGVVARPLRESIPLSLSRRARASSGPAGRCSVSCA